MSGAVPPPGPELALPPEPAELRARTRALAEQDPAGAIALLGEGEWILDQLWDRWGGALERSGMGRERLRQITVDYRRELWLWVMGERTWEQCAGGLLGRVRRRSGGGGSGGLKSEAGTQVVASRLEPSGSPPVGKGSGGLKSEAGTTVAGGHPQPSGSPPVDQGRPA